METCEPRRADLRTLWRNRQTLRGVVAELNNSCCGERTRFELRETKLSRDGVPDSNVILVNGRPLDSSQYPTEQLCYMILKRDELDGVNLLAILAATIEASSTGLKHHPLAKAPVRRRGWSRTSAAACFTPRRAGTGPWHDPGASKLSRTTQAALDQSKKLRAFPSFVVNHFVS